MVSALAFLALPAMAMAAAIKMDSTVAEAMEIARAVASPEIVGGITAVAGEFPYIVSLQKSSSHFCGGVLYNAYTVLTAAHCSVGQTASSVSVRAGTLTWASGGTLVGVSEITVHPSYVSSTIDSDVAVWHLSTAFLNSSTIGYVTMPVQGSDPATGLSTTTAGWGLTSESGSTLPAALREVTVPVISRASCRAEYGTSAVTTNMFCAGLAAGGKDSCSGDSGGPIIDASTGVLIGLVSWGQGCAEAGYAGVYSRLGNFVTWVETNAWTSL
ncbi:trypsin-like cysteine/serine peptidase domain-containing protein [Calycina marina]|uniref:Trypsin-like cysteine/serine peptidase domain-containing protein n=1 Tax=Calycina marina TaxID=1763456 RepID=A0A9P7Z7H5_9HELO|nr:trypsin-like cysteine/serine peptidase domain-containing protein [Calycina marina]